MAGDNCRSKGSNGERRLRDRLSEDGEREARLNIAAFFAILMQWRASGPCTGGQVGGLDADGASSSQGDAEPSQVRNTDCAREKGGIR